MANYDGTTTLTPELSDIQYGTDYTIFIPRFNYDGTRATGWFLYLFGTSPATGRTL